MSVYKFPAKTLTTKQLFAYQEKISVYKFKDEKPYVCEKQTKLDVAYQWGLPEKKELDKIDEDFISQETSTKFTKLQMYGYHTYGGHNIFFRPDLIEVIHLINEQIPFDKLDTIERIYVSTVPHPSDDVYDCFDYVKNMHKGLTTCYVLYKQLEVPSRKRPLDCEMDMCAMCTKVKRRRLE